MPRAEHRQGGTLHKWQPRNAAQGNLYTRDAICSWISDPGGSPAHHGKAPLSLGSFLEILLSGVPVFLASGSPSGLARVAGHQVSAHMSPVVGRKVQRSLARPVSAWSRHLALPVRLVGLFLAFVILGETSYLFVFPPSKNALFWLPTGLTLALFLRARADRWAPWLLVIVLAQAVVVLRHGQTLPVAASWGLAAIFPVVGALL